MEHVQLADPAPSFKDVKHSSRAIDRSEHTHQDAENQSYRESFDLLRSDNVKYQSGNQGRYVRIDNRHRGFVETVSNRHPKRGPFGELFADSFKNQNVRINGHTHRQYQTGQSCQGQRLSNGHDQCKNQNQVQHQGETGNDTGESVIDDHKDQDDYQRSSNRPKSFLLKFLTQAGFDVVLANRILVQSNVNLTTT